MAIEKGTVAEILREHAEGDDTGGPQAGGEGAAGDREQSVAEGI